MEKIHQVLWILRILNTTFHEGDKRHMFNFVYVSTSSAAIGQLEDR